MRCYRYDCNFETGGKQYKVSEGDIVYIEKLDVSEGDTVAFDKVLTSSTERIPDLEHRIWTGQRLKQTS